MINTIEGRRSWVSDKALTALAECLGVDVYQLFTPVRQEDPEERDRAFSRQLILLKEGITADITADIDQRFAAFTGEDKE
jgi:hypothetical protein